MNGCTHLNLSFSLVIERWSIASKIRHSVLKYSLMFLASATYLHTYDLKYDVAYV